MLAVAGGCREAGRNGAPATDAVTRPPITEVLARHTDALMKLPGVVGTGEGREGETPVVVVFVVRRDAATVARIPATLEGWRVVVRESGVITAPPR